MSKNEIDLEKVLVEIKDKNETSVPENKIKLKHPKALVNFAIKNLRFILILA